MALGYRETPVLLVDLEIDEAQTVETLILLAFAEVGHKSGSE